MHGWLADALAAFMFSPISHNCSHARTLEHGGVGKTTHVRQGDKDMAADLEEHCNLNRRLAD